MSNESISVVEGAGLNQNRNYTRLFTAVAEAVETFASDADVADALRNSFESARVGLGARKAVLLLVDRENPSKRKNIVFKGLNPAQVAALERGESTAGVSGTVIAEVIASRSVKIIQDPRLVAEAHQTVGLSEGNFSVLCAPIVDPYENTVLAVLYFQNSTPNEAYTPNESAWAETYSRALGAAFGFYLKARRREKELTELLEDREPPDDAPELIGDSPQTVNLRKDLHEIYIPAASAEHPAPLLILGEKGTGKEVVAKYIQAYSERRDGPFKTVNMASLSHELIPNELFGHVRGAFTGAQTDSKGYVRAAHKGVLFLDEIGHLDRRSQAQLLRLVDYGETTPLGSTDSVTVDVLLVLATNLDLKQAVKKGDFLDDLYDRLMSGHVIQLSPLRERVDDIVPLLEHFRRVNERKYRRKTLGYTPEVRRILKAYPWPANVREIAGGLAGGLCYKLVMHTKVGAWIDRAVLEKVAREILEAAPNPAGMARDLPDGTFKDAVGSFQRELIQRRIEAFDGDIGAARGSLGMSEANLRRYVRLYKIGRD